MNGVAENYVEGIQGVPLEWREFSAYSNPLRHCHLPWVIGRQRSPKGHLAFDDLYGAISSVSLILLPAHTTCGRADAPVCHNALPSLSTSDKPDYHAGRL